MNLETFTSNSIKTANETFFEIFSETRKITVFATISENLFSVAMGAVDRYAKHGSWAVLNSSFNSLSALPDELYSETSCNT